MRKKTAVRIITLNARAAYFEAPLDPASPAAKKYQRARDRLDRSAPPGGIGSSTHVYYGALRDCAHDDYRAGRITERELNDRVSRWI